MWFFYPLEVKIMNPFLYFVDSLSAWMGKMFAWCIVLLTFATVFEVFVRYVLYVYTSWAFDMALQLYGALFMMSGSYTLSRDGHVRGDVIHRPLPIKYRASLDLTLYILFLMPGCVALVYYGYEFASDSWRYKEVSWSSPARTQIYFFKTIIPLAGFLVLLQGIAEAYRCVICIRTGAWPARLADVEETEDMALNTNEETGELAK